MGPIATTGCSLSAGKCTSIVFTSLDQECKKIQEKLTSIKQFAKDRNIIVHVYMGNIVTSPPRFHSTIKRLLINDNDDDNLASFRVKNRFVIGPDELKILRLIPMTGGEIYTQVDVDNLQTALNITASGVPNIHDYNIWVVNMRRHKDKNLYIAMAMKLVKAWKTTTISISLHELLELDTEFINKFENNSGVTEENSLMLLYKWDQYVKHIVLPYLKAARLFTHIGSSTTDSYAMTFSNKNELNYMATLLNSRHELDQGAYIHPTNGLLNVLNDMWVNFTNMIQLAHSGSALKPEAQSLLTFYTSLCYRQMHSIPGESMEFGSIVIRDSNTRSYKNAPGIHNKLMFNGDGEHKQEASILNTTTILSHGDVSIMTECPSTATHIVETVKNTRNTDRVEITQGQRLVDSQRISLLPNWEKATGRLGATYVGDSDTYTSRYVTWFYGGDEPQEGKVTSFPEDWLQAVFSDYKKCSYKYDHLSPNLTAYDSHKHGFETSTDCLIGLPVSWEKHTVVDKNNGLATDVWLLTEIQDTNLRVVGM